MAVARDRPGVFAFVQELLDDGTDPGEFMRGLGDALRTLLALRLDPDTEAVDLTPESRSRFAESAAGFSPADLLRQLAAVSEFEARGVLHRTSQQRIQLEVLLLRLVSMDSTVDLEELLSVLGSEGEGPGSTAHPPSSPPPPRAEPIAPSAASPPEGVSAPETSGADEDPSAPLTPGGAGAADAWAAAVTSTPDLGGAAIALRGARVEEWSAGTLSIRLPSGLRESLDALLGDPERSAPLRASLARELGVEEEGLRIEVRDDRSHRLTSREASQQRMDRWTARDPRLKEAVEELDLTLKE